MTSARMLWLICLWTFFACRPSKEELLQDVGVVQGSTSFVSHTDSTCILKLRYAINSNAFDQGLLPTYLFHFDNIGSIYSDSESTWVNCEALSTEPVTDPLFPASIFLLMDKAITSITTSYTKDHLTIFKQALFQNLNVYQDKIEVNAAVAAKDNSLIPEFETIFPSFQHDISRMSEPAMESVFDLSMNGGVSNIPDALQKSINYITEHATYPNRILFLFTDNQSGTPDSAQVSSLVRQLKDANIHVVVYSTLAPDDVLYSQRRYVNAHGYQMNNLAIGLVWSTVPRTMKTLFEIFDGKQMYETTVKISAPFEYFKNNRIGLLRLYITLFNSLNNPITPLYEK